MLQVTNYIPPNGKREVVTITSITQEDADFFNNGSYKVSMEELNGLIILYSTTGIVYDGEDQEQIYIVPQGQSCFAAMRELRKLVEESIK